MTNHIKFYRAPEPTSDRSTWRLYRVQPYGMTGPRISYRCVGMPSPPVLEPIHGNWISAADKLPNNAIDLNRHIAR